MYVTQAAQFSKYTAPTQAKVPLVAGRAAEVRVFAISPAGANTPKTTNRVKLGDTIVADIPEPPGALANFPASFSAATEPNTSLSYHAPIPASLMVAGSLPVTGIVLDGNGNETNHTFSLTLDVRSIGSLSVGIVPLTIGSKSGTTADIGTALVPKFWPFAALNATNVPPVTVTPALKTTNVTSLDILDTLESKRKLANFSDFYYGLLPPSGGDDYAGIDCGASYAVEVNNGRKRDAFGADNNAYGELCEGYPLGDEHHVMPHELAHAFGLDHAPCPANSPPPGVDPWFAKNGDSKGFTASDGWDADNGTVPDGSKVTDVMGYCSPYWVSAYDWSKVVSFFETGPIASGQSASPASASADSDDYKELPADQLAIHETASFQNGQLIIESGWTDYGSRFHTNRHDDALFEGLDKNGHVVFSLQAEVTKMRESTDRSVDIDAPISAVVQAALAAVRLTYEGMTAVRYGLPPGPIVASVVAADPGHATISFDGRHFDFVLVCASGHQNCQIVNGDGTERSHGVVELTGKTAYLTFTNGIKSVAWEVPSDVQGR